MTSTRDQSATELRSLMRYGPVLGLTSETVATIRAEAVRRDQAEGLGTDPGAKEPRKRDITAG